MHTALTTPAHVIARDILTWAVARGLDINPRFQHVITRLRKIVLGTSSLPSLLGSSQKTVKGEKKGILTGIMYLSPYDEAGVNMCPFASAGCAAACLGHSSGRMAYGPNKVARIIRTWWFMAFRGTFQDALNDALRKFKRKAHKKGMRAFVRLNGTSDIPPAQFVGAHMWPHWRASSITFYDYTKDAARAHAECNPGYDLTFSRSEATPDTVVCELLDAGVNVAVVFADTLPDEWLGWPVIDGDETDARPTDNVGVIVGLTTKGPKAKRDTSGFVVRSHLETV